MFNAKDANEEERRAYGRAREASGQRRSGTVFGSSVRKQDRDGEKYQLLRQLLRMARDEAREMQLVMDNADHNYFFVTAYDVLELEKLVVSEGAAQYLEVLCRKQDRDGEKYQLLRQLLRMARDEAREMQLVMDNADHNYFFVTAYDVLGMVDNSYMLVSFRYVVL
nr:hypothetical protein [Tanacetum cinerariifolium]